MLYHKSDAKSFTIPGGTEGVLYPPSLKGDQSVAVISMDGHYPKEGYSRNDVCTETLYLLEGAFEIEYDGAWHTLIPGDIFMILPDHKYRTKGMEDAMKIFKKWLANYHKIK